MWTVGRFALMFVSLSLISWQLFSFFTGSFLSYVDLWPLMSKNVDHFFLMLLFCNKSLFFHITVLCSITSTLNYCQKCIFVYLLIRMKKKRTNCTYTISCIQLYIYMICYRSLSITVATRHLNHMRIKMFQSPGIFVSQTTVHFLLWWLLMKKLLRLRNIWLHK